MMKVREVIRIIESDGWYQVRMKGSHRQIKHDAKIGLVTVPGQPNDDLAPRTLSSILKQAGLR
jgi:predicted RNA binding protein YcfA (HicA-like mRNA interferase family)